MIQGSRHFVDELVCLGDRSHDRRGVAERQEFVAIAVTTALSRVS
jgi:hypothetical protein